MTMFSNSTLLWGLWKIIGYFSSVPTISLLVFICVTLTAMWLNNKVNEIRSYPPGPWGLPIVGYLPFIGVRHITFLELAQRFGEIFSVRLGNQLTIVLGDYKLIREAFRLDEFTGRPSTPLMDILDGVELMYTHGNGPLALPLEAPPTRTHYHSLCTGIINSEGRLWKSQRRFLHEKLRGLGMSSMGEGRKNMIGRIKNEVYDLMANLRRTEGAPIDANPLLAVGVSNVICGITMSQRFTVDDDRFAKLNSLIEEGMRLFGEIHYGEYVPQYNYLPGKAEIHEQVAKNRNEMFEFYETIIKEHRRTLDMNNPRDLVDIYLIEIEKAKSEGTEKELFEGRDHDLQIKQVLGDLFSAGMETIKSSLMWMLVFMLRNPDIKRRVQAELDTVIGRDRLPSLEDMPNLPYTEATILESQRMSSIVPLGTTHTPTRDVFFNGYKIPAGSHVVPLINCVHMDPNLWEAPKQFNPSRFFDENGKIYRPQYFMPFGVGRRMCLGDVLARMELSMFFASVMHQFDVQPQDGVALPSLEGIVGATIAPQAFRVKFVSRAPPVLCPSSLAEHSHLRHVGSH